MGHNFRHTLAYVPWYVLSAAEYFKMSTAHNRVTLVLLAFQSVFNSDCYGGTKVWFKRLENCHTNTKYLATYNVTFTVFGDKQHIDGVIILAAPIDNSLRSNCSVDTIIGGQYIHTLTINQRKKCESLNKFLGEFLYDIERYAQIMPGMCPIPKGTYHLHNVPLNVEKIPTLNSLPFGHLCFTDTIYDEHNNVYTCLVYEVEILN